MQELGIQYFNTERSIQSVLPKSQTAHSHLSLAQHSDRYSQNMCTAEPLKVRGQPTPDLGDLFSLKCVLRSNAVPAHLWLMSG